jgi:predicted permease
MGTLIQDVKFGLRMLAKNPGFTTIAVLTLALGIGANAAIFSVVEGVLLAPLPYRQPDRLVLVWLNNLQLKNLTFLSYPDFIDWQRNARSFHEMAAFNSQSYNLTAPGAPVHLDGREISAGFFTTLGVKLALGREFSPEEDRHGGAPVVIISDRLWRDRFGGSLAILGESLILDGRDYTIVGVLPAGFRFGTYPRHADVYTPLGQGEALLLNDRTIHNIACLARLNPGVSIDQAQPEMNSIQEHIDQLYPALEQGLATEIVPLKQQLVGDVRETLLLLLGAVGLVLLIACANIANLLLARWEARKREFAVRLAVGASRSRVARQLVTEGVLLSLVGGAAGLAIAEWGVNPILAAVPGSLPRHENIGVNVPVLLFTLGVSIAVGILFSLAPALKSRALDLQVSLKEGSRAFTSGHRAQDILVISQVGLTLVLLVGAGLLFRTIRHLWEADPGFDTQRIVTFQVGLSSSVTRSPSTTRLAYQQMVERIRQNPGVQAAEITALVPLAGLDNSGPFLVGLRGSQSVAELPRALFYWVGPDYLRTMKIPLLRGRFLKPEDTANSDPVVVIDSVLARTHFPGKDPVGLSMKIPHWGTVRIIGVVGHVRHWTLGRASTWPRNQIYCSLYQLPGQLVPVFYKNVTVIVRTVPDAGGVFSAIKKAVYGSRSDWTVYNVQSMQEIISDSMSSQRFPMLLLGVFAGLALVLAAVGIYGVISYSVTQRVHEIGVRMALGAMKDDVVRLVIAQGLRLVLAGLAIGIAAALIITRLLSSFSDLVYGVAPNDPITIISVSILLTGVGVMACHIPARRATKVDPMVALRYE